MARAAWTMAAATAVAMISGCAVEGPDPEAGVDDPAWQTATLIDASEALDEVEPLAAERLEGPTQASAEAACTLEARPAALVEALDQTGTPLTGASDDLTVLYSHRDATGAWSEPREALCIDGECRQWALGYATPGEYLLGAFACGDYAIGAVEVGMTDDDCHVDTVATRLQLDAAPECLTPSEVDGPSEVCAPDEAAGPALVVMTGILRGDMIVPHVAETLTVRRGEAGPTAELGCFDPGCTTQMTTSVDNPGQYRVAATMCGETLRERVKVERDEDGCGLETEWVALTSDAEQCATTRYTPE